MISELVKKVYSTESFLDNKNTTVNQSHIKYHRCLKKVITREECTFVTGFCGQHTMVFLTQNSHFLLAGCINA
jgi:hypothetical protein